MSDFKQIESLRTPATSIFNTNTKHKKSLIYEDGNSISRAEALHNCRKSFLRLCEIDSRFNEFEFLYSENTVDLVPVLLKNLEFSELMKNITHFMCLITCYLDKDFAILAFEWLIYKFEVHIQLPEDLLMCCLPLHTYPIFIKFIRLFDINKPEFSWLEPYYKEGMPISSLNLSTLCLKNPNLLYMFTNWPLKVIDITNNDQESCKELCHIIMVLGMNVFDKVRLMRDEKRQNFLAPFVHLILNGLKTKHENMICTSIILLQYFASKITLEKPFLKTCIKKILKNQIIKKKPTLRAVLYICDHQNYKLNPKMEDLFKSNVEQLDDNEKQSIEEFMRENVQENAEEMDMIANSNIVKFEVKEEKVNNPKSIKSYKELLEETKQTINIEWQDVCVEEYLLGLLLKYVLNWFNLANTYEVNTRTKFSVDVLKLLKMKPVEMKFEYKAGGLLSHLSCCALHPNDEVRKISMKLLKHFSKTQSKFLNFKRHLLCGDYDTLYYGKYSESILTELDGLDFSSLTITILSISIVNSRNLHLVPKFKNIWSMILSKLNYIDLSNETGLAYREEFKKFFVRIQPSFSQFAETNQKEILSALMSDLNRDARDVVVDYLSELPLSLENYKFLLGNINFSEAAGKRKSIVNFKMEPTTSQGVYSEEVLNKINIILSAFCRGRSVPINDQLVLFERFFDVLKQIVNELSRKNNGSEDQNVIELVANIMSTILFILTPLIESKEKVNLETISNVKVEVFSKCLHLFQNSNVTELNLTVIQYMFKLGIGMEKFNLMYFISWIGNHLVPKEDKKSTSILINIIKETVPLCIRQKSQNSCEKVQIIRDLIRDCAPLHKNRVLLLFESIVTSLSESDENDNVLWIQLILMTAIKPSGNEGLIMPLLKKFSPEIQILSLKKLIMFLSNFIQDPSRKRKFDDSEISDSPNNKKRKTNKDVVSCTKNSSNKNEERHFVAVKILLSSEKVDAFNLLKTIINYSLVHLKNSDSLITATESLKEFIRSVFASMKLINSSSIPVGKQNEICVLFHQIIEQIAMALSRNVYFSLLIDLIINEADGNVKSKCLELFANKLSFMVTKKIIIHGDEEFEEMALSILPMLCDVILNKCQSLDWNKCLSCISSFVALGLMSKELAGNYCVDVFSNLLTKEITEVNSDTVILITLFFKNFISSDKYKELLQVFNWSLNVMEQCIDNSELRNGALESSLSLMYAIISRADSSSIDWECFGRLLEKVFQISSLNSENRKVTEHSIDFLKQIRSKLSKMSDTKSLISTCAVLLEKGIVKDNLCYISSTINVFGCHLIHLNKMQIKYCPSSEEDSQVLWSFIQRTLSLKENHSQQSIDHLKLTQDFSIKSLNQLCYLFEFDMEIMTKLKEFIQNPNLSPKIYLERNCTFYEFVSHLVVKSSQIDKTIEFVNNSELISNASGIFKHFSVEIKSKKKTRKNQPVAMVPFPIDSLVTEAPVQCGELIKSMCNALIYHLKAEHKCGMNLSISDETIDLISNICRCMISIDQYFDKSTYQTITMQHIVPLIIQIAINSFNDEALLTPLALGLCKHNTDLAPIVHLAILNTLSELKVCLGSTFDSSIRDNVSSFLEDCKLHDDENIVDLASEI